MNNNKKGGEAHIGKEWDSDERSSKDEGVTILTFNKSSLFIRVNHMCIMAKETKKNLYPKFSSKYTFSDSQSNDESSDEEDMNMFFRGRSKDQIAKVNELIKTINEKDELWGKAGGSTH